VARDLRWGVFVTIKAPSDYVHQCFSDYGAHTDTSGWYTSVYRSIHFVGLELNISVLKAGLQGEATGYPIGFTGDVVAMAKRDLAAGEILDGEGGYCVYGVLRPSVEAVKNGELPIGLAHDVQLKHAITANQPIYWSDVIYDEHDAVVQLRRDMERIG
jgi:predicted homoserine dehydrogenase-like protein